MATRCCLVLLDKSTAHRDNQPDQWVGHDLPRILYRHWDGYPDGVKDDIEHALVVAFDTREEGKDVDANSMAACLMGHNEENQDPNGVEFNMRRGRSGDYEDTDDIHGDVEWIHVLDFAQHPAHWYAIHRDGLRDRNGAEFFLTHPDVWLSLHTVLRQIHRGELDPSKWRNYDDGDDEILETAVIAIDDYDGDGGAVQ